MDGQPALPHITISVPGPLHRAGAPHHTEAAGEGLPELQDHHHVAGGEGAILTL